MARIALGLSYNGAAFEGWQTQPHGRTVQDSLEKALCEIAGQEISVVCAGRTDAGVHARRQVVHFECDALRPESAWVKGVNHLLPPGVAVQGASQVDDTFHARFSAVSRTYRYLFYCASARNPLTPQMTWVHYPVNLAAMLEASRLLLGEHDFSAFRAAQCQAASPVRTLHSIDLIQGEGYASFQIHGNAFLHHMVRNIMGCLFEVGLGRKPASWVAQVLESKDRTQAARTYPPDGLVLWDVEYPQPGLPGILFDTNLLAPQAGSALS